MLRAIKDYFLRRQLSTPEGRAHILALMEEGEASGESELSGRLKAHIIEPRLLRLIEAHGADEIRHAHTLRACIRRTGVTRTVLDRKLSLIRRIVEAGGLPEPGAAGRDAIMRLGLFVLALEELVESHFDLLAPHFRRFDPSTADALVSMRDDERLHRTYWEEISRYYAPSETARLAELKLQRRIAARAYAANNRANFLYMLMGRHRRS